MDKKWLEILNKLDYAFQAIIHSHTGKIYAVEALIRNVELIPKFNEIQDLFDTAYRDDFLYELDLHLREKAIKKFSNINIDNLKLFYNLDNRIIYNKDYSKGNTKKILEKYNLNKSSICFELSEKGSIEEQNGFSAMIQNYKDSGYCIAIDDFGVGVSGLKLLYLSEANVLKLDKFFIQDINNDAKKKLFCSSIVDMAHILGMKVVAEGVEEIKEYYTCKDIGIDFIQGYLVQKPTLNINEIKNSYEEIIELIEKDRREETGSIINNEHIEYIKPLHVNTSLYDLFVYFKENSKNTFVPILDDMGDLLGVIHEVDIKKLSYSQYGLSLAKNVTFSSTLKRYIKPCLSVESSWGVDKILESYNQRSHKENGIFITQASKYQGFINLNSLLTLSYQRNLEIASNQNPLTKLPGNQQIEKFINNSIENRNLYKSYFIYFDFNDFKPFNDKYGFRLGDRAILIFSELLQKKYPKETFIAHIGGDDFFVGIKSFKYEEVYKLTLDLLNAFKSSVKNLYSYEDKKNGFVYTKDRFNVERKFNLLSCSCAILCIDEHSNIENIDYSLGILKKVSKKYNFPLGSCV